MTDAPQPEFQSVRLFPKHCGANAYDLTGIAARCDWVLFSDTQAPHTHLHRTTPTDAPRHIFLSLRNPFAAIAGFATDVLPLLKAPFVLVSGSEDSTLPQQCDHRWRTFTSAEQDMIDRILNHPLLIHWFAENLVDDSDPRFSPLPTGMVYPQGVPREVMKFCPPPLHSRPLQMLCGHRVRGGAQWDLRRDVTVQAQTNWAPFCTMIETDLPEPDFLELVGNHAFVLCVEGGGVDPSPKAWQAILHGAIPIIRKTGTYTAYNQLPVAFVDSWAADALTPAKLANWHRNLAPFYDQPAQRAQVLTRLGLSYWWDQIDAFTRG